MLPQNDRPTPSTQAEALLEQLASLYGVERCYRDVWGRWRKAPADTVMRVLTALGVEVSEADWQEWESSRIGPDARQERLLREALAAREAQFTQRLLEPVYVAWGGNLALSLDGPKWSKFAAPGERVRFVLAFEDGGEENKYFPADVLLAGRRVQLWRHLPFGYHRLVLEAKAWRQEAVVISAPPVCWPGDFSYGPQGWHPAWGVFTPVYALPLLRGGQDDGLTGASELPWTGVGDLGDLAVIRELVSQVGGSVVATLPLLALFPEGMSALGCSLEVSGGVPAPRVVDVPFDPSPYRPSSRLFWNELYLALDLTAEWQECTCLQKAWGSGLRLEAEKFAESEFLNYPLALTLKRELIRVASRCFFGHSGGRRKEAFAAYMRAHPEVQRFAEFCARQDYSFVQGGEAKTEVVQSYLYGQWQLDEQLGPEQLFEGKAKRPRPADLMLDFPVGVHPRGFDVWRWPTLFARDMSVGAPPDLFFEEGQNWACPPLRPATLREDGYVYLASCLRHHMQHASYLRIDHIMWLHRTYWIPEGKPAAEGVYVTYPTDELYAVLCLESWRNRTVVVGEDLGTVGRGVRARLRRHGILGTWVLQGALKPRAARPARAAPPHSVALLGTHDMFPFAGYVRGKDIATRLKIGKLGSAAARRALAARRRLVSRLARQLGTDLPEPAAVFQSASEFVEGSELVDIGQLLRLVLRLLACSEAPLVLVGVRDLLLETEAENIPGTGVERPNWRRRLPVSPEQLQTVLAEAGALLRRPGAGAASAVPGGEWQE